MLRAPLGRRESLALSPTAEMGGRACSLHVTETSRLATSRMLAGTGALMVHGMNREHPPRPGGGVSTGPRAPHPPGASGQQLVAKGMCL